MERTLMSRLASRGIHVPAAASATGECRQLFDPGRRRDSLQPVPFPPKLLESENVAPIQNKKCELPGEAALHQPVTELKRSGSRALESQRQIPERQASRTSLAASQPIVDTRALGRSSLTGDSAAWWQKAASQWNDSINRVASAPSPPRESSRRQPDTAAVEAKTSKRAKVKQDPDKENNRGELGRLESTEKVAAPRKVAADESFSASNSIEILIPEKDQRDKAKSSQDGDRRETSSPSPGKKAAPANAAVAEPEPEPRGTVVEERRPEKEEVVAPALAETPAETPTFGSQKKKRFKKKRRKTEDRMSTPKRSLGLAFASCSGGVARVSSTPATAAMQLNESVEMCMLCCDEAEPRNAVRLGDCSHGWYCLPCMKRYAESRLDNGSAHVPCPECGTAVAEHDLKKLLPAEVMNKLLERSLEQAVSCQADLKSCPTANCPMRVALEDDETGHLKCPLCKKSSCVRCGAQPFHRGLTCAQYAERKRKRLRQSQPDSEALLRRWMEETGTKQCPTCQMAITKESIETQNTQRKECHKMMCRNCNTRFCFKCLAVLTESYTCGCSIDLHGFVNPHTGKRISHFRPGRAGKGKGGAKKNAS